MSRQKFVCRTETGLVLRARWRWRITERRLREGRSYTTRQRLRSRAKRGVHRSRQRASMELSELKRAARVWILIAAAARHEHSHRPGMIVLQILLSVARV